MNSYENAKAKDWTLADECAGLNKEPGVDIETAPTKEPGKDAAARADACQDYMANMFAEWCEADGMRKVYVIDDLFKYAIFERSYFHSLSRSKQKLYKQMYGRFCVVVDDYFFDWVNKHKYKQEETPLAQMWLDECGDVYRIDTQKGKGHMLTRIGQDKELKTTADYWVIDKNDVALKKAVNRFAEQIGKAMDAMPTTAKEKRGPGRPPKTDEPEEGSPEYIEKKRNEVMGHYWKILSDRYSAYAGYERNRIVERIKEERMATAVTMNDLARTGSLVPMQNCLYDLTTSTPRSAKPEDYISAWAPTRYVKDAKDEQVTKFLNQFTCDRADLLDFLAQVFGVGLDLNMITRTMLEMWGETTTNGKSTLVKALVACLGKGIEHGLSCELPPTVIGISANSNDDSRITPSLGMVGASRLIFASEPKAGMKVDWSLVKRLTGGDVVSVNEKYQAQYNIDARALLVMDCNNALKVDDHTLFSRGTIQIAPCDFQVTESIKDKTLDAKLSTESAKSALMNFMLNGYKSYIENGKQFSNPPCVHAALLKNKEQSDRILCFVKDNYIMGQPMTKKVTLSSMWEEYREWCLANGYKHTEVRSTFYNYFQNKPSVYTMGDDHKQFAVCGIVKRSASEEFHSVISGDPIDWYIAEFMVEEAQADGHQVDVDGKPEPVKSIKLEVIHNDYKRKVTDAGVQPLDFWPFYGVLMGKGWNITMGVPGDTSTITVAGWHMANKAEVKAKQEAKIAAKAASIRRDVKNRLTIISKKNRKAAQAIKVLMDCGLNNLLDGASDEVRRVIMDTVTTGMDREMVINTIAHE